MVKRLTPYVPWFALVVATTALFTDAKELRTFVKQNADVFPAWFLVGAGYAFLGFVCLLALYWVLVLSAWEGKLLTFTLGFLPAAALSWAAIYYTPAHPNDYGVWPHFLRTRPSLVLVQFFGVLGLLVLLGFFISNERDRLLRR